MLTVEMRLEWTEEKGEMDGLLFISSWVFIESFTERFPKGVFKMPRVLICFNFIYDTHHTPPLLLPMLPDMNGTGW